MGRPSRQAGSPEGDLHHPAAQAHAAHVRRHRHAATAAALLAAKDHVNLFLYDGAIVPDPDGIITGGHGNATARTIAFRHGDPIPQDALTAMLRQIVANNRAGGWRRLKGRPAGG